MCCKCCDKGNITRYPRHAFCMKEFTRMHATKKETLSRVRIRKNNVCGNQNINTVCTVVPSMKLECRDYLHQPGTLGFISKDQFWCLLLQSGENDSHPKSNTLARKQKPHIAAHICQQIHVNERTNPSESRARNPFLGGDGIGNRYNCGSCSSSIYGHRVAEMWKSDATYPRASAEDKQSVSILELHSLPTPGFCSWTSQHQDWTPTLLMRWAHNFPIHVLTSCGSMWLQLVTQVETTLRRSAIWNHV